MKNKHIEEPHTKEPTAEQLRAMNWNLQYLMNYLIDKKLEIRTTNFEIDSWKIAVGRDSNGFACKWILEANEVGMKITPLHKQWSKDFDWHNMHEILNFYLVY